VPDRAGGTGIAWMPEPLVPFDGGDIAPAETVDPLLGGIASVGPFAGFVVGGVAVGKTPEPLTPTAGGGAIGKTPEPDSPTPGADTPPPDGAAGPPGGASGTQNRPLHRGQTT